MKLILLFLSTLIGAWAVLRLAAPDGAPAQPARATAVAHASSSPPGSADPGARIATAAGALREARALIDAGDFERARAMLLARGESEDGEVLRLLSEASRELGLYEEAVEQGERAAALSPDDPAAHLSYARAIGAQTMDEIDSVFGLLKAKSRIDRFLAEIDRVRELDPQDIEGRKLKVMYHLAPAPIGDQDLALEICAEIEAIDRCAGGYWTAVVRERRGETELAVEVCRQGIADCPDELGFRLVLGRLLAAGDDPVAADEQYAAALEGPECDERHLALYERAKLRIEGDFELSEARAFLGAYIEAAPRGDFMPSVAHAQWRLGMALEGLGQLEEARRAYEESVRLDPEFASAAEALAKLQASG